jgi:hypothetical protein
MGLMDRQRGLTVAATALALSPDARRVARRGLVYGVAGTLKAGEVAVAATRGAVRGVQSGLAGEPADGGPASKAPAS